MGTDGAGVGEAHAWIEPVACRSGIDGSEDEPARFRADQSERLGKIALG